MSTTPNYEMFLSTDEDQMSNTDQSLNDVWDIIEDIPICITVSVLPITDFSYSVGDKIYHSGLKSIFILIAQNAAWGNFWRPVQTKYGPWVQPGTNIIADPATYKFGTTPINYKLTNTGKFIFRGSVDTVASTGYVNGETSAAPVGLVNLPVAIAPSHRSIFAGAAYPITPSTTKPTVGQLTVRPDGSFSNVVWNPSSNVTGLFYNGWEWIMGYSNGYGPTN